MDTERNVLVLQRSLKNLAAPLGSVDMFQTVVGTIAYAKHCMEIADLGNRYGRGYYPDLGRLSTILK